MNSYFISVPSKTFLVGEYGALLDGPAFLINTKPRFEINFHYQEEKEFFANPIENEKNPLHQFWNENEDFLLDFDFDFIDPYASSGGFGASSAQWAAFYAFVHQYQNPFKNIFDKTQNNNDFLRGLDFQFIEQFIQKYRSYFKDQFAPSGYDVISQWVGKITFIDLKKKILKRMDWPFDDLGFVLVKNSEKIPTHEHLKDIKNIPAIEIESIVNEVQKAFEEKNSPNLVSAIQKNFELFQKVGLVAPQAQKRIENITRLDGVLAAKGCGALGCDVFFVLVDKKKWPNFSNVARSEQLHIVATHGDLSHGFEVDSNFQGTPFFLVTQ